MLSVDDRGYWRSRANTEREAAAAATDPTVTLIHSQLADEYEARAEDITCQKPALRVVGDDHRRSAPGV